MAPFEAGHGTGREAVFGSGKEARGLPPIPRLPRLIVVCGIDESENYRPSRFSAHVGRLAEIEIEARERGVEILCDVWDYPVTDAFQGQDVIAPGGRPSFDFITYFSGERNTDSGSIAEAESVDTWVSRIVRPGVRLGVNDVVVMNLDNSGSIETEDWGLLHQGTIVALLGRFPEVRVSHQLFSDEEWVLWFINTYDLFMSHQP